MVLRKIGVEEELMLVDPDTGFLASISRGALQAHEQSGADDGPPVEAELFLQQLETQTPPCTTLDHTVNQIRLVCSSGLRAASNKNTPSVA